MTELLTAAQMRAIEQAAIDSGEVTGLELMERAGKGVVEAILEEWPELAEEAVESRGAAPRPAASPHEEKVGISTKKKRAVVLCGPGNNGGDGFVVARLLHERGWAVEVFLYGEAAKLPPDARLNYQRWLEMGAVNALSAFALRDAVARVQYNEDTLEACDSVFVDALFGTGMTRPFGADLLEIAQEWTETCYVHGVSVDLPSGICSDSGVAIGGSWFPARLGVTFERPKLGHFLGTKSYDVKRLKFVALDVDWPDGGWDEFVCQLERDELELDREGCFESGLQKSARRHKFSHGHALVLSGPSGQTGAARMSARGALRIGAGLVTVGVPAEAQQEAASQLTAIMLKPIEDASALTDVLQDSRINALCLGPALGLDRAKALVAAALDAVLEPRPTVLDADALSAFADDPEALFAMLHEKCVLTPHGGEFARLFPDISEKLNAVPIKGPAYSKVDATREAAKRAGCVVLFKGADTVIAAPDGRCSVNAAHYERAAPWLATAGSGDVLAGFITGLLARGFDPMQAAETAAWLHVECALKFGPGLIAEDIPEQLPAVFRDLGL